MLLAAITHTRARRIHCYICTRGSRRAVTTEGCLR
jgi:hypothetical protein